MEEVYREYIRSLLAVGDGTTDLEEWSGGSSFKEVGLGGLR